MTSNVNDLEQYYYISNNNTVKKSNTNKPNTKKNTVINCQKAIKQPSKEH
jgi:hypothetical protein